MLARFKQFFSRSADKTSKDIAKDRLRQLLVHDRVGVSPQYMDMLKGDMVKTVSNYMDVDCRDINVCLNQDQETMMLVANISVSALKRPTLSSPPEEADEPAPKDQESVEAREPNYLADGI